MVSKLVTIIRLLAGSYPNGKEGGAGPEALPLSSEEKHYCQEKEIYCCEVVLVCSHLCIPYFGFKECDCLGRVHFNAVYTEGIVYKVGSPVEATFVAAYSTLAHFYAREEVKPLPRDMVMPALGTLHKRTPICATAGW
jgi:hypothetical protein